MLIYCVEDDADIRDIEVYTLRSLGFEAEGFETAERFFASVRKQKPSLVLLDVMLPEKDGVSVLKELKGNSATADIPVIMATAKGGEYDKITSLDIGADDYIVKPFGMLEMAARVKAVLRRASAGEKNVLKTGTLVMNLEEHSAAADGKALELTLKEYELLKLFMLHPNAVFTRDELLNNIWGIDYDGETRTVDVHIRMLRTKLGKSADIIKTVRGVGYRMEAEKSNDKEDF